MSSADAISRPEPADTLAAVRAIQHAWRGRDLEEVGRSSRALLEREPGNRYGLIYLSRCAAYARDWAELTRVGEALVAERPAEAFAAGIKLSRAHRRLEAARLFAALDFEGPWVDDKLAEMATAEGYALLAAGDAAAAKSDVVTARTLWVAARRLAPRSQRAKTRLNGATREAKKEAGGYDAQLDPAGYLRAWREVLWLNPTDILALSRIARAIEHEDGPGALDLWLRVLAVTPEHEAAISKVGALAKRHHLEGHAIERLTASGGEGRHPGLYRDLARERDAKARAAREVLVRQALARARELDIEKEPRLFLDAWKAVLALDPSQVAAAKKVVVAGRQLDDYAEVVIGIRALLENDPANSELAQRLAASALRGGKAAEALEVLTRLGRVDLDVPQIAGLHGRVSNECRSALRDGDFPRALSCFRVLEKAGPDHPVVGALRSVLANKAAAQAMRLEKQGELAAAAPLARQVLDIVPDHPVALTVAARELWREHRYAELVELCRPQVTSAPEYDWIRKLVDRAVTAA